MEQRRQVKDYDLDDNVVRDLSILLGVVAAAFVAIGVMAYVLKDDPLTASAINPPPMASESEPTPSTTGQGGAP